jgi:vacuolar-type H+-ATPase subunit E/Vma4
MTSADKIKNLVDQAIEEAEPLVDKVMEKAEPLVEKARDTSGKDSTP